MSASKVSGDPWAWQGPSWGSQGPYRATPDAACRFVIEGAAKEGVLVALWPDGILKVQGQGEPFTRWADIAWAIRPELERYLAADRRS